MSFITEFLKKKIATFTADIIPASERNYIKDFKDSIDQLNSKIDDVVVILDGHEYNSKNLEGVKISTPKIDSQVNYILAVGSTDSDKSLIVEVTK